MRKRVAVIGSGPNGLAAAIRMAQAGSAVEVFEGAERVGGATRSGELTLPNFVHDFGSAIHPMGLASPFFSTLRLERFGMRWLQPEIPLAHPLDDGSAAALFRDLDETANSLGADREAYLGLMAGPVRQWSDLVPDVLKPQPSIPRSPVLMARFGLAALQPARGLANSVFVGERARALFAGLAAHSFLSLDQWMSASFGIILAAAAHAVGWPIPAGGSQSIADALTNALTSLGGAVTTNHWVHQLSSVMDRDAVFCDITPRQFLRVADVPLASGFRAAMQRYKYGPGIFKLDWALTDPIPWKAEECRRAGTVHVGGTLGEIARSEQTVTGTEPSAKPFIILAQPSVYDRSRAPEGKHTAWAYAHVPNGWTGSLTEAMEMQIERFAPGFRDCILARKASSPAELEGWNPNLVGGDIGGGMANMKQFILRPTMLHYRTSIRNVYLCSSSTPPGGGVHGMCGYHAAESALRRWRVWGE